MKVLLMADVKKVGRRGTVVEVADGYALNVLIPKRLAVPGTAETLQKHAAVTRAAEERLSAERARTSSRLKELNGSQLVFSAKAGDTGTLFKSIQAKDIVAALRAVHGFEIPETAIFLAAPIKKKGTYQVPIVIENVRAEIRVTV